AGLRPRRSPAPRPAGGAVQIGRHQRGGARGGDDRRAGRSGRMSAIGDSAPGGPQTVSAQGGPSAPTPPPGAPARQSAFRRLLPTSPAYMSGVLLVLILIFSAIDPAFHSTSNFRNILTDASILLVMAVGMTYVMVAAGFDLSIGSVLVFSGVVGIKAMVALGTDKALPVRVWLVVSVPGGPCVG